MKYLHELEIGGQDFVVTGSVTKGSLWTLEQPPEDPDFEVEAVSLKIGHQLIDFTDFISEADLDQLIYDKVMEEIDFPAIFNPEPEEP